MTGHAVVPLDLADVVELVNEFSDAARLAAGEQSDPYPSFEVPSLAGREHSSELLRAVANDLHPVFSCGADIADAHLNELLARTAVAPRLGPAGDGDQAQALWTVPRPSDELLAACAIRLWSWLTSSTDRRLGICDADHCVDTYVDRSPAGRRRYCSTTCSNRVQIAAYRARLREAPVRQR
ncbi:MAG: CGNR zinc finger domain-containing protein [Nitriliruptoraceae bacterium]|nr:CGNR zinc finger domain-containing protein [Nitriliruptoraceae bacterium]